MKKKLVSLNNSGESFEKVVSLYYYTLKNNDSFYKDFDVTVYYGHNLPKKEKKICAQGTIGFYDKYYSKDNLIKYLNKNDLIKYKHNIINYLVDNAIISKRVSIKYKQDDFLYWNYIKNLPLGYLYPHHKKRIIDIAMSNLDFNMIDLYCEDNVLENLLNITEHDKYSIYALEYNGKIGRYYLNYKNNKQFAHIFNMLNKKSVLSGNSAFFLEQILRVIKNNYLVGYRNHSHDIRKNRNYVLEKIITTHKGIIEPKNIAINQLFSNKNNSLSTEEKANMVYAEAYYCFLKEYKKQLNLKNISEVWYENL